MQRPKRTRHSGILKNIEKAGNVLLSEKFNVYSADDLVNKPVGVYFGQPVTGAIVKFKGALKVNINKRVKSKLSRRYKFTGRSSTSISTILERNTSEKIEALTEVTQKIFLRDIFETEIAVKSDKLSVSELQNKYRKYLVR